MKSGQFNTSIRNTIKFFTDTGVIVEIPPRVFVRFTANKNIPLNSWLFRIKEQLKWVNNNGIASDLDLNFDYGISRNLLLRFVNNIRWNDQDYIATFENGPSLFQKISNKKGIGLENVKKQLELLYPNAYSLAIKEEKKRFNVSLKLLSK